MSKIESRHLAAPAQIEIRKSDDGKTVGVRGYAAVYDSEAYGEVIRGGAFNRTIEQQREKDNNVRLLVNHDGVPLASTKQRTLTLGTDERGMWFDAPELDMSNPDVQRLVSAMSRGDIDQCSFAGYFRDAPEVGGVREVREVQLVDVSVVTYPWYEETSVGLTGDRNGDLALVALRSLTPEKRDEVLALLDPIEEPVEIDEPEEIETPEPKSVPLSITEARALLGLPAA